jgi:hypothetical protein
VKVACSIAGETWKRSGVLDVEPHPSVEGTIRTLLVSRQGKDVALGLCRARWALFDALVLGKPANHFADLFTRRDAVFAALADMARAEEAAFDAQRRLVAACPIPFKSSEPYHESYERNRPSSRFMAAYVERLIEQVGALP